MQNIVKFQDKEIELVNIDGAPFMTATQIGSALGIAEQNGCTKIYNRHADEFTPEMTRIVKHGRTRVRVFNREGAWLIGIFARTPIAATFRKWVLVALGKHVDGTERAELSAEDKKAIGGIVKKCAAKAVKDEIAALPAPSFNPQALVEALEKARREEEPLYRYGGIAAGKANTPAYPRRLLYRRRQGLPRRAGRDRTVKRITARKPP